MTSGAFIRNQRRQLGLTRQYVADKLDISRSYLASIEKTTIPSREVMSRIAELYKLDDGVLSLKTGRLPNGYQEVIIELLQKKDGSIMSIDDVKRRLNE